ncbi:unnamed protein product [Durusdinium trenchii]
MILYDNKSLASLCKCTGSVFPKAFLVALLPVSVAALLKSLALGGQIDLNDLDLVTDGSVYGSFAFVLGFTLVFRCQQAYQRYFASAKALHMMSSEWLDACGSLLSFIKVSRASDREQRRYEAVLVRLFCLLHAIAMEELCSLAEENFHLLDIEAFAKQDLKVLHGSIPGPQKVQVVLVWIKYFIVQGIDTGLLSIPPPILTRVYQEIGAGMAEFHDAQLISMWPFPFPYAQLSLLLTVLHMMISPLIMVQYTRWVWSACFLTCVSVVSVVALNIISLELENPFGEDHNDLPANEVHDHFRDSLLVLSDPDNWQVPRLLQNATLDFGHLKKRRDSQRNTIADFLKEATDPQKPEVLLLPFPEQAKEGGYGGEGLARPGDLESCETHAAHAAQVAAAQEARLFQYLEKGLERQALLLETFLAKQTGIFEQHAHVTKSLATTKAHSPPSVFAAPLEQEFCGCTLKRR